MIHAEVVLIKRHALQYQYKLFKKKKGSKRTWQVVEIKIVSLGLSYGVEVVLQDDGEQLNETLQDFKKNYEQVE